MTEPRVGERAAEAACGAEVGETEAGNPTHCDRKAGHAGEHARVSNALILDLRAETAVLSARLAEAEARAKSAEWEQDKAYAEKLIAEEHQRVAEARLARAEAALREARAFLGPLAEPTAADTYAYVNRTTVAFVLTRLDVALADSAALAEPGGGGNG